MNKIYQTLPQNQAKTNQTNIDAIYLQPENLLINAIEKLSPHAKALFGSIVLLTKKYGIACPSTALLQKFGAGCRDTQLLARQQLLDAGLLIKVYRRVKKGTRFLRTNLYIIADWLLHESFAFTIRCFCHVPLYAPIRNVQLWSKQRTTETSTSKEVDSILGTNSLNPNSSSSLTLFSYQSFSGSSSSLALGQSIARVFRGNAPSNSPYPAHTPKAQGDTGFGLGFVNKSGEKEINTQEPKNLKGERRESIFECKDIFSATAEESKILVEARAILSALPKMKKDRIAIGMPMSAEKEKAFILKQLAVLTPEEIEVLRNEGLV